MSGLIRYPCRVGGTLLRRAPCIWSHGNEKYHFNERKPHNSDLLGPTRCDLVCRPCILSFEILRVTWIRTIYWFTALEQFLCGFVFFFAQLSSEIQTLWLIYRSKWNILCSSMLSASIETISIIFRCEWICCADDRILDFACTAWAVRYEWLNSCDCEFQRLHFSSLQLSFTAFSFVQRTAFVITTNG